MPAQFRVPIVILWQVMSGSSPIGGVRIFVFAQTIITANDMSVIAE
jgi:hypothetical protein